MQKDNIITKQQAKKIGGRQGLWSAVAGLVIAQLIVVSFMSSDMGFMKAFFWFISVDFKLNLFVGAITLLLSSYLFGRLAGKWILIDKWKIVLAGFVAGITSLLTTAFLSGWLGFFHEGLDNIGTNDNPFVDYIFKPMYWVVIFGIVPALLIGIWLGWSIKRKGAQLKKTLNT